MKRISFTHFYALLLLASIFIIQGCKKDPISHENNPPASPPQAVGPTGHMSGDSIGGPFTFITNSGGVIYVDLSDNHQISFTHEDYENFEIDLWGNVFDNGNTYLSANHESLNGKHLKDRLGNRRTIVFPDGAKITMHASGVEDPLVLVCIYDGAESHGINASYNMLVHSSTDLAIATDLDNTEADGEAGGFEFSETGLIFFNNYTEDIPGEVVTDYYLLGELEWANPNLVTDYYE